MKIANCPNCGGGDLYRTAFGTPASGMTGPNLLPKVGMGQLFVVVCSGCGLTRFFTRRIDIQTLQASGDWVKVTEPLPVLGLTESLPVTAPPE